MENNTKHTKKIAALAITVRLESPLSGCVTKTKTTLGYEAFAPYVSGISQAQIPTSGIFMLGEATHGNKEFTDLKREVFEQAVEQSNICAFTMEGDFGGSQKVNDCIQNGAGTVQDAARGIGFTIYRTEEMTTLLNWMHDNNEGKPQQDQIRFFG